METKRPARDPAGEPVLVVATPSGFMQQFAFGLAETLVAGRDAPAMAIPDDSVSRRHAEFRADPLAVRDLGSTNGTRVQGASASGDWVDLAIGSVVELGDAVVLVRSSSALGGIGDDVIHADRRDARPAPNNRELVVASAEMTRLCSLVELVGPSRLSVLIIGETGVGKEVIARAVHRASPRRDQRMLAVNCAAIAASLIESELFGFEKGAFTGAAQAKPGIFEAASGGTVFLDEVGEMPLEAQAKLLRVLESGEVMRIGSRDPIAVDVRCIAATHRDLVALAASGEFRLDLLYRISGVTLSVPALRERPDDIVALVSSFLGAKRISNAALEALKRHGWPGNVRELKSTIERAELLARGGTIDVEHLTFGAGVALGAPPATAAAPAATFHDEVAVLERARIFEALEACGGNQSRAARRLGISRATLVRRLASYRASK